MSKTRMYHTGRPTSTKAFGRQKYLLSTMARNQDTMPAGGTSQNQTYVVGEDRGRLARAAESFGLQAARRPLGNVRNAVATILSDTTLELAKMHSVGVLAENERVDHQGTLHVMTLTRRKRRKEADVETNSKPSLQDLFTVDSKPNATSEEEEVVEEIVDTVAGGSLTAAVFGIVKGTIGPAILYLPRGFQLSGYAFAVPSLILATISYIYSAHRLLESWKVEKLKMERLEELRALLEPGPASRKGSDHTAGYGATKPSGAAAAATDPHLADGPSSSSTLLTYPELARRAFGPWSSIIQIGIAMMQFGVCLTYLIFVPQNLVESTRALFGIELNKEVFLVAMVLVEIPLAWIRDIRKLTTTNILATVLIAYGLASCLIMAFAQVVQDPESNLLSRISQLPPTNDTWYLFVGTSFFVFEGSITLVVPLQEAVFHKEEKEKFPMVNQNVTTWILVFYVFFAVTCWAAFGENVKTALTASLPEGAFATVVQFAYSIAVIFTFPLQAFPAMEVVFHSALCRDLSRESASPTLLRNVSASAITCFLGIVAFITIDSLGNVVSLLGSLVGIPLALIFPPLMHNVLVKDSSKFARAMNMCVAGLGMIAMGVSSFTTILSWDAGTEG